MDLNELAQCLRPQLALVTRTDPLVADDAIARRHRASLDLSRALNNFGYYRADRRGRRWQSIARRLRQDTVAEVTRD